MKRTISASCKRQDFEVHVSSTDLCFLFNLFCGSFSKSKMVYLIQLQLVQKMSVCTDHRLRKMNFCNFA